MPSYVTPKKNTAFIFYTALEDQANAGLFKSSPTLAAGDFKVSIDGGALANLATLPTNTPGGVMVKISLSADEMNGDNITVVCIDAAGAEWYDQLVNIQTSAARIDDLATPTNITAGTITTVTTVTNGVTLADDAITASKFDESTAFPLAAADSGSTYVARTGADGDTLETLSDQIDGVGGSTGSGAISFPITINDEDNNPIDGVEVWVSTDNPATNVVAGTLSTDALGLVTFMLDAGTYYVWRQKSGYNFTNPVTITVS